MFVRQEALLPRSSLSKIVSLRLSAIILVALFLYNLLLLPLFISPIKCYGRGDVLLVVILRIMLLFNVSSSERFIGDQTFRVCSQK